MPPLPPPLNLPPNPVPQFSMINLPPFAYKSQNPAILRKGRRIKMSLTNLLFFRFLLLKLISSSTHRFIWENLNPTSAVSAVNPSQTVHIFLSIWGFILVLNPTDVRSARESLPSSLIFNSTSEHILETNPTSAGFQVKNNVVAVKSTGILSNVVFNHYKVH